MVATAIIGLLLALLIPAVLMAREAARRGTCTNNLKQLAIAVHSYHESKNVYPAALGGASQSILVELLPYMDSLPLYNQFNFSQQIDDMSNRTALSSRPSQFTCPSDSYYPYPNSTSYAGNIGDASYKSQNNGFFDILPRQVKFS
jgi:type II secretory pathway pseudopilin PulG